MVSLNGEVEWGVAALALPGEAVSGDRHVITPAPEGLLLGVVDGLGHGQGGAAAAEACVETIERYAAEPLLPLLRRCHERLRRTRGVTASLAFLNTREGTMTWVGVGDVAAVLLRPAGGARPRREHLLCKPGVVGQNLPTLHAATLPLGRRDLLVFATDGVEAGFEEEIVRRDPCERIAGSILSRHGRGTDDALVLAVRYLGGNPGPGLEDARA